MNGIDDRGVSQTAPRLTRNFPDIERPKSAPDDPHYAAELAASLGTFAFWLHDQWPALLDRVDGIEKTVEGVDSHVAYLIERIAQMEQHLLRIIEKLGEKGP